MELKTDKANWIKQDSAKNILHYAPINPSNRLGIEFINMSNVGTLTIKFISGTHEDRFFDLFSEHLNLISAIRRGSTIQQMSFMGENIGRISTKDEKSIGLLLRTVHQILPFDDNQIKEMISLMDLPVDAFEKSHSYNSCVLF